MNSWWWLFHWYVFTPRIFLTQFCNEKWKKHKEKQNTEDKKRKKKRKSDDGNPLQPKTTRNKSVVEQVEQLIETKENAHHE